MTIRTLPNQPIPSSSSPCSLAYAIYYWMKWMTTASPTGPGWTVKRSSDGAGTVEGVNWGDGDYISNAGELENYVSPTRRSWFVLRAPDGSREIMFVKPSTSAGQQAIYLSPSGGFTGGDAWNTPTASDTMFVNSWGPSPTQYIGMMHCAADDAAPYGFWMYVHLAGAPAAHYWSMAQAKCDVFQITGDTDPFVTWVAQTSVAWTTSYLSGEDTSGYGWRGSRPIVASNQAIGALYMRGNASAYFFPNNVPTISSGEDVSMPVSFGRNASSGTGYFKGVSSFFQWNGAARAVGEMFENRTRVSLGDMNVPWDGSSVFIAS